MELTEIFSEHNRDFLINIGVVLVCGLIIGAERELRDKPAGISTQTLVIGGAMAFAFMSQSLSSGDPGRIAAQIVSGIGFLGAGLIFKSESKNVITNVTTAASIWYAASIGMAIGFEMYVVAILAALFAAVVARFPHIETFLIGRRRDKVHRLMPEEVEAGKKPEITS